MLEAIIFDMDGVLTDSEAYQQDAERHVLAKYGVVPTKKEWDSFTGRTNKHIFTYIHDTYLPDVDVEDMIKEKRAIILEKLRTVVQPIPGASEFVKYLAARKSVKVGLVTSSIREQVEAVLSRFGILSCFNATVTGDEVSRGKPDPEPYLLAIKKLRVPAASCVVIEDSVNGMKSARAAGTRVIGLSTTFSPEVIRPYCDHVARTYQDVRKIVDEMSR